MTIPCIWSWHFPSARRRSYQLCKKMALELGYRTIDTAQIYENEAAVGRGYRGKRRAA